jgi:diacylglycerol kinase family enzyme
MVVAGTAPDRQQWWTPTVRVRAVVDGRVVHEGAASAVVVASGQHLRGLDVAPRGHPGDGRLEVQVYALARGERRAMRGRLATASHLPHPRIHTTGGRRVEVTATGAPFAVETDGRMCASAAHLLVEIVPGAFFLLV